MTGRTPIRNGDIYCSPRCGGQCTYEQYQAAVAGADELVRILGEGWEPCVWDNLGWHYEARKGCCVVKPFGKSDEPLCTVFFNSDAGQVIVSGVGYRQTLDQALAEVERRANQWMRQIDEIRARVPA